MAADEVVAVNQLAVRNEPPGVILLAQHGSGHRLTQPTDVEPPQYEKLTSHGESVDLCPGCDSGSMATKAGWSGIVSEDDLLAKKDPDASRYLEARSLRDEARAEALTAAELMTSPAITGAPKTVSRRQRG